MSNTLREAIRSEVILGEVSKNIDINVDAILDAVIAEVKDFEKVGTDKMPLSAEERCFNIAVRSIADWFQSAKGGTK